MSADESVVLTPPRDVLAIATRLEEAGYETWCVGGAVRDALLGHPHADWDLATAATPDEVMRLFRRTVPVGVEHGTVAVLKDGIAYEVTTFRHDVRTDGRHAEVEFGATLDEDLARRDFTINAIAYSPSRHVLHDPFGGRVDLGQRVVRAVGRATDRMREDRLRALRALRFAARFGFAIEPGTWAAIVESAPALTRLSPERVREELTKTMEQVDEPSRALMMWRDSGALAVLVPALANVDALTIESLDCLARPRAGTGPRADARAAARRLTRLAALFVGLPVDAVRVALRALRFSNADLDRISNLVAAWERTGNDLERALLSDRPLGEAEIRRWVAGAGRFRVQPLFRMASARWGAIRRRGGTAPTTTRVAVAYRRALESAYRDPLDLGALAIDGDDLVMAGIARGPQIGVMLRRLLDAVIDNPASNERERLLELARRWSADSPDAA